MSLPETFFAYIPMTETDLQRARAICEAVPAAPWSHRQDRFDTGSPHWIYAGLPIIARVGDPYVEGKRIAEFITGARTLLPAALAEIDRLREELATARRFLTNEMEVNERMGARNRETMQVLGVKYPNGILEVATALVEERDQLRREVDTLRDPSGTRL